MTPSADRGVTAVRVVFGLLVATLHGWHKLVDGWRYFTNGADWPLLHDTVQLGLPYPLLFAMAATLSQFAGGWLLVAGAATRIAAFMVAVTMTTAVWFNLSTNGPDVQLAGLYALVAAAFVAIGGGRWSLDRMVLARAGAPGCADPAHGENAHA
jgi:putative oxidoreductase